MLLLPHVLLQDGVVPERTLTVEALQPVCIRGGDGRGGEGRGGEGRGGGSKQDGSCAEK